MQLTKQQIEALKGKCKGCDNTGEQLGMVAKTEGGMFCAMQTCEVCLGNKKATIEIDKEWVECSICDGSGECDSCANGYIPKYQVGQKLFLCLKCYKINTIVLASIKRYMEYILSTCCEFRVLKLKIISETEDKLRICLWN